MQARACNQFGLPVALLLIVELLLDLLGGHRTAESASESAIRLLLALQQRAVRERNLWARDRHSGDRLGVFDVFRVGLRWRTRCTACKRNSAQGCRKNSARACPPGRLTIDHKSPHMTPLVHCPPFANHSVPAAGVTMMILDRYDATGCSIRATDVSGVSLCG